MHDGYDGLHFFLESWFKNSMTCLLAATATHEIHLTITVEQCMENKKALTVTFDLSTSQLRFLYRLARR
jgi:hypothetical protein